ncbi:MAG: tetratricopeptide repeat protein [Verrucomicrobiales bacterium]|nr:tetratricopeptide repeat protein [Verrucomicrobiales bacterium]
MNPTPQDRAAAIFADILELPPSERDAHLVKACENDPALFEEIRALIAAHEEAPTQFLLTPAPENMAGNDFDLVPTIDAKDTGRPSGKPATPLQVTTTRTPSLTEKEGDVIGPYKLLQQIGEGGFGTVWMAEQSVPISRKVALKVIKAGMDTKEVLARFEAERQALAMMDHQHIAKVLDAGATTTGRPWFAMELVKGIPVTEFCDEHGLGTKKRLELFGDVCGAVNHAHQKGIIHRDLKPSNVMVTLHGDKAVVKVIDFGIAKATQGRLTDKTLFTRYEQFIGTPVYMSPEQASLSGLDIDTRSDIYALGVLLYELLVGKPPFDGKTLISAGYDEMRRIIREEEPLKPSSRLSSVFGEERSRLAKARKADESKLNRLVEPDLDWIVMKAIEKDRSRRYETANAFARDIGHFLADEPVSASPPGAGYKFRKFARRNKAALRVAAAIVLLLVVATAVSSWQAVRATLAERKTAEILKEVAAERDAKEEALKEAEAVTTFLTGIFRSPDPARDGRTVTVAETLDHATKKLETELVDQPWRRAKLQASLSGTYYALGLYPRAISLQEQVLDYYLSAFGPEHLDTLTAKRNLAVFYNGMGRHDEALKLREEVLQIRRKKLGAEHPDTLSAIAHLAVSYKSAGRIGEAVKLQERVLELTRKALGREHPDSIDALANLAAYYYVSGRSDDALDMREEVLSLCRKVKGPEHPGTLTAMNNLAAYYSVEGRLDEALNLEEETLVLRRKVLGAEHPDTIHALHNLATYFHEVGRVDDAIETGTQVLALNRKMLGPDHPDTLSTTISLAFKSFYSNRTRPELREDAIKMLEALPDSPRAVSQLGFFYYDSKPRQTAKAIAAWSKTVRASPKSYYVQSLLGELLFEEERYEEALAPLKEARAGLPVGHKHYLLCRERLLKTLTALGREDEAQEVDRELSELLAQRAAAKAEEFLGERAGKATMTQLVESGMRLDKQRDGMWAVDLSGVEDLSDLTIFQGTPVGSLNLSNTAVVDLAPLHGMALRKLNLGGTKVADLSPLKGLGLEDLTLNGTSISDISALRGLPLTRLELNSTLVTDLEPLRGMPLKHLGISIGTITDLQPLEGMPLEYLNLINTRVSDLSALRGMPLTSLRLIGCRQLTDLSPLARTRELTLLTLPPNPEDIDFLRTYPGLERLSFSAAAPKSWIPDQTVAEFWEAYDAGKTSFSNVDNE